MLFCVIVHWKKKRVWEQHPFCLNTFWFENYTWRKEKRKKCMWFDIILLGQWLLYAIKYFFVVCCLVNQIKTSKKMNDKTTWWNKISNVVKCDLHILIVSCISDFVLHHIHCVRVYAIVFFVSSHNLMCYVPFYACWLLVALQL
jgi:hypothetical protein